MSNNSLFEKFLRFTGIVLMALTGGFTPLGGIGTSCAALFPTKFGSMAALAPFQWLYILFVLGGVSIGVWGIWATVKLVKGTSDSYSQSTKALVAGTAVRMDVLPTWRGPTRASTGKDAAAFSSSAPISLSIQMAYDGVF